MIYSRSECKLPKFAIKRTCILIQLLQLAASTVHVGSTCLGLLPRAQHTRIRVFGWPSLSIEHTAPHKQHTRHQLDTARSTNPSLTLVLLAEQHKQARSMVPQLFAPGLRLPETTQAVATTRHNITLGFIGNSTSATPFILARL